MESFSEERSRSCLSVLARQPDRMESYQRRTPDG